MNEPLSAYQVSKKLFDLWMQHVDKRSGELDKSIKGDLPLYVRNLYGQPNKVVGVSFDPTIGYVLAIENKEDKNTSSEWSGVLSYN